MKLVTPTNTLRESIAALSEGNPDEVQQIRSRLCKEELRKGEFLLREGEVSRHYYFIEQGAVRLYYLRDGVDYTVWIGTAGQIFTNLDSYLYTRPSTIYIEAIEPVVAYTIHKETSDQLARQLNAYNTLLRKTAELAFVNLSRNVMSFQSEEATDRYDRLEEEKNWINRYPLRYISSFIGVTQSSLSRLRAKRVG